MKHIVIASAMLMIVSVIVVDMLFMISVVNVMDQVLQILSATAMEPFVIVMENAVVNGNSMTVESVTEQVISNLSAIVSIIPEIVKEPAAALKSGMNVTNVNFLVKVESTEKTDGVTVKKQSVKIVTKFAVEPKVLMNVNYAADQVSLIHSVIAKAMLMDVMVFAVQA